MDADTDNGQHPYEAPEICDVDPGDGEFAVVGGVVSKGG